jgi:glycosyltransferase involved in cell wall biosynthesis
MDFFAVASADQVWNLSPIMVSEREKRGLSARYKEKQITVPMGTDLSGTHPAAEPDDRWTIAFMGHLRPGQGAEFLIDAIPDILQQLPDVRLMIIGTGPLEADLKSRVISSGISQHVTFTGFVPDHQSLLKLLRNCTIGVAPYVDHADTFARYGDPGKPKAYLSAGLPVIITRVTPVAHEIDQEQCGIAIEYSRKALVDAVIALLDDESKLKAYRENAIRFARKYEWDKVFIGAFASFWNRSGECS